MEAGYADWLMTLDASDTEAAAVLEGDRIWNCFALADLMPPFRAYSQVAVAYQTGAPAVAACLILRHPALVVVSPFGTPEGVAALLARLALPEQALIQALEAHLPLLEQYYRFQPGGRAVLRMAISVQTFQPPASVSALLVERLTANDGAALGALYAHFPETHFRADLLEDGVFYGVRCGDQLVAAGGTHAMTRTYGIAVLGNIFTHPGFRRHGYARAITATLVTNLLAQGYRDVVLNVVADNSPAISLYTSLGFQTHCHYWTARAERIVR